jgi:xylulose-5-phosphate/fructose-6-phosphate phosphoketolase
MEVLQRAPLRGLAGGLRLTGRHGIFVTYEAFAMVATSMVVQRTKWLEKAHELPLRKPVPSLNILLTSTYWRNDHNGFSHLGPGLIDTVLAVKGTAAAYICRRTRTVCCRWPITAF